MNKDIVKYVITISIALAGTILLGWVVITSIMTERQNKPAVLEDVKNELDIQHFHDDEKNVTCWYSDSGRLSVPPSISCVPDSQLSNEEPKCDS